MIFENNIVKIVGEIVEPLTFSHEMFCERFYETEIAVKRNSGNADFLPVMISNRLADCGGEWVGQTVSLVGEIRSFNGKADGKNKLKLHIFVHDLECMDSDTEHKNEVYLRSYICKETKFRRTPLGREIADVMVATNRGYGKSDYIPCICWGRNARFVSELEVGTFLELEGRFQSREYLKRLEDGTEEVRTAYEVSVSKVEF